MRNFKKIFEMWIFNEEIEEFLNERKLKTILKLNGIYSIVIRGLKMMKR